jgi:hypothetical protein
MYLRFFGTGIYKSLNTVPLYHYNIQSATLNDWFSLSQENFIQNFFIWQICMLLIFIQLKRVKQFLLLANIYNTVL